MVDMPNDTRMALGEILGSQKHLVKQLDGVVSGFQDFRKEMRDEPAAGGGWIHQGQSSQKSTCNFTLFEMYNDYSWMMP